MSVSKTIKRLLLMSDDGSDGIVVAEIRIHPLAVDTFFYRRDVLTPNAYCFVTLLVIVFNMRIAYKLL